MKKYIFLLLLFINILTANTTNEQILKKLDQIQHNQELIKQEMKLRFEAIDKRFEAVDKRFEAIDKRFEMLTNFMMTLTGGIFALIGFMMWDRRTIIEKAKKEMENSDSFAKKADKEYVDRLIRAMNELLTLKDETAQNVFKKYGLL